ncbi:MAG: ATP-binding protein [Nitrosomonadaceae bacterium]|nr:ATP-binding protein [Nitrosomonadaceae bacterium]
MSDDTNNMDEFGTAPPVLAANSRSNEAPPQPTSAGEDKDMGKITPTQWTLVQPDTYVCIPNSVKKLPAGMYHVVPQRNGGIMYEKQHINIDELLDFPDSQINKILGDIDHFWTKEVEANFKHYGYLHRRGYMFYGPQGSGKTCLVQQLIKRIIDAQGIVFYCTKPVLLQLGLAMFRTVEPNRPIICIFEDIDAIIKENGDDILLGLLDGENQVDRVLNIATTNYPELLDKRLVNRPRRFDRVIRIDWPSAAVRKMYFEAKLKIPSNELDEWVAKTDKLSFAACAELVISVKCLGKDFNETVDLLKKQNKAKPKSSDYETDEETPIGFGRR